MKIFWTQNSIPAFQGLSAADRDAVKRAVILDVWKHWQVWLPFASLLSGYAVFFLLAPPFQYRLIIVVVSLVGLGRLAALPCNFYLQQHASRYLQGRASQR